MNREEEIAWMMLAMVHHIIVLEHAVWLVQVLPPEESDELPAELDELEPVLLDPPSQLNQLESKYYNTDPKDYDRARRLAFRALHLTTHQRAFAYVCADAGLNPELILRNLPGNSGFPWSPGMSNPMTIPLVQKLINVVAGGKVDGNLLSELILFYEMQLAIFRAKFDEVLEDEEAEPVDP